MGKLRDDRSPEKKRKDKIREKARISQFGKDKELLTQLFANLSILVKRNLKETCRQIQELVDGKDES